MPQLTPMMVQYRSIKEQHKDKILFYRLGDFYEMFFEDALIASKALEITLTGRDCGLEERAPMCGVPFHAADIYIAKLIDQNFKVAICEQVEDPPVAKGIVKREVIKIITPGTITNETMLDQKKNNFILSIYIEGKSAAIAYADLSTGELASTYVMEQENNIIWEEIARLKASEIIMNIMADEIKDKKDIVTVLDTMYFDGTNEMQVDYLEEITNNLQAKSINGLLAYLGETQKASLAHMKTIKTYELSKFMQIDSNTRQNLEISETIIDKKKKGSLLSILDKTSTAMGSRKIRQWLETPLMDVATINARQDAIEELLNNYLTREELKEYLKAIYDIERLATRIALASANARDLIAFKKSISYIPIIMGLLHDANAGRLMEIAKNLDGLEDVYTLIDKVIEEEPPLSIKEGGIIKKGYDDKISELIDASVNGKNWMMELEQKEKEKTGIKNLKIGYNRVFGYYIDITKSNIGAVPDYFIRKQTLSNSERYITPDLKELENIVLGAQEKLIAYENEIFIKIRDEIATHILRIQKTAGLIAEIDCFVSLAEVAQNSNYNRPLVDNSKTIEIEEGRHPVVEAYGGFNSFVPNNVMLDTKENRMMIITGPNMAGKSTYMRQVALITLIAQIGSFVPAKRAHIGLVDRIFTRVGASDDLASGRSTFMVEMSELANILKNATVNSLIILDEIGRGTSTFDGLSIAWSVIEHMANTDLIGAKTLFATHYHELTQLEGKIDGVKNYCISVIEEGKNIVFLRTIIRGNANGSYGIHVARLAGLPEDVLERADEIIAILEQKEGDKQEVAISKKAKKSTQMEEDTWNLFSFAKNELREEINKIDIDNITPRQALDILARLKKL